MFVPLVPAKAGTQKLKSLASQNDPGFPLEPVIGRPKAGPVGGNERSGVERWPKFASAIVRRVRMEILSAADATPRFADLDA